MIDASTAATTTTATATAFTAYSSVPVDEMVDSVSLSDQITFLDED